MHSILRKIFRNSSSTMLEGAKIIHETKKAYLVEYVGQKVWIPKSLVLKVNNKGIEIVSWFVEKHFS